MLLRTNLPAERTLHHCITLQCDRADSEPSLDLTQNKIGIARHQALLAAIHQEIQFFHHDSADEGCLAFRLDDGGENAVSAKKIEPNFINFGSRPAPAIGITNFDLFVL